MFCARIATCILESSLNKSVQVPIKNPNVLYTRGYRDKARIFSRRAEAKIINVQSVTQGLKQKLNPLEVGQIVAGGGAALGLGALCYYGLGLSNEPGTIDRMFIWPSYVKARIRDTYMYFGASVAMTAASAVAVFKSPLGQKFIYFCNKRPLLSFAGIIALLMGSGTALMSIPYSPGFGTKQMMWLFNCGVLGLAVAPIGFVGGAIALKAAWYTAGIIGGLSTVAMCAPSEKFLTWGGPLGIGLGAVIISSLGSVFLPPTTALGISLYSVSLYGGLILFSAFLLYDTQKIIHRAETHPNFKYGDVQPYDPINASHHIVMDSLNIFIRIAQILAMGGLSRRK